MRTSEVKMRRAGSLAWVRAAVVAALAASLVLGMSEAVTPVSEALPAPTTPPKPRAVASAAVKKQASDKGRAQAAAAAAAYDAMMAQGRRALQEQEATNRANAGAEASARSASDSSRQAGSMSLQSSDPGTQGKVGNGDYTATPLSAATSWSAGGSAGSFSWSYPFRSPTPPAGPQPDLQISYDSGSVDGRNSITNNQTSVVGEGFDLATSFIERSYLSCHDDGHPSKYDLCWRGERLTLVLGGNGHELVQVGTSDIFRLKDDNGSTVERLGGSGNGARGGEFWRLTTSDGTRYDFGRSRLPGWTEGAPTTNSAWTVPVVTDDAGDPAQAQACAQDDYAPATSWCQQGWRWNLDLVVDTHGNAATYWYQKETNEYARNGDETSPTEYDRGGYLERIDYGLRSGGLYSGAAATHAPYRVSLQHRERCLAEDCSELNGETKARWPDVPFDSLCGSGRSCQGDLAPTFFTRKRLVGVKTAIANGATYRDVDAWTLDHVWVDPGNVGDTTDQILWPSSIAHKGVAATPAIETHPVELVPSLEYRNRVDSSDDGIAPLRRPRLSSITTETGAVVDIFYSAPDCAPNDLPDSAADNQRRCYPVWWSPYGGEPEKDWFHKYVVEAVSVQDTTTGDVVITDYEYGGGAAWHYDDNPLLPNAYRTWSQWRGYERVTTLVGNADSSVRSASTSVYMRGMNGDRAADGGTKRVEISGVTAPPLDDDDELAGSVRETVVYNGRNRNGDNGGIVTTTIRTPYRVGSRASHTYAGGQIDGKDADPATVMSTIVGTKRTIERTRVTSGTEPFYRSKTTEVLDWDSIGLPVKVGGYTKEDDRQSTVGNQTCTTNWYARNPAAGILTLVSRTQVLATSCENASSASLPVNEVTPGDVISDTLNRYDDATDWQGQTPTTGDLTWTGRAKGYAAGAPVAQVVGTTEYDALGRIKKIADAAGNATKTVYEPVGAGVMQTRTDENALGHKTTTTFDPAFMLDTQVVDANGNKTEKTYDALGRLTAVWLPNVSRSGGAPASYKFAYSIGGTKDPAGYVDGSWISTSSPKGDTSSYITSYEIFDALLRPRQLQSPSPSGGRLLTDTYYNDRGLTVETLSDVWDSSAAPNGTRQIVEHNGFLQQNTVYDGANRPTTQTTSWTVPEQDASGSTRRSRSMLTTYTGDSVAVEPPAGGLGSRVTTDALGRVIERRTYAGAAVTGKSAASVFSFDKLRLKTVTSTVDSTAWNYTYDLFGRLVSTTDPDSGTTRTAYTVLDQVDYTVDALNRRLQYTYDKLGRKTGLFSTTPAVDTNRLAEWTYDGAVKGIGLPSASTRYTAGKTATGPAYTRSILAYDPLGRAIRSNVALPTTDPLLASQVPAAHRVAATLESQVSYNRDGSIKTTTAPAVPGLSAEVLSVGYDSAGLGFPRTLSGATGIVQDASYSPFGDVAQLTLGLSTTNVNKVWLTYNYDGLRRLQNAYSTENSASTHLMDAKYSYNDADQVKAITDTAVGNTDYQCFHYEEFQQLKHAWTPTTTSCADTTRTPTTIGGKAPYWQTFTYKDNGLRETSVKQPTSAGGSATTTEYSYGGTCAGSTTPVGPHTLVRTKTGTDVDDFCANAVGDLTTSVSSVNDQTRTTTRNAEGNLATVDQGGTTKYSYIYDADGELLIKRPTADANGVTTLYLGSTEVQLTKSSATQYAAKSFRYYQLGGQRVGVRVGQPGVAHKLYFQAGDPHGTSHLQWDASNTSTRTKRYTDPFGNSRGPGAATWVDDKGFLGKSHDPALGLTHVGARAYDPALGMFLSLDPLLNTADPLSLNGYSYANNNPVNLADPTGLANSCVKLGECTSGANPAGGVVVPTGPNPESSPSSGSSSAGSGSSGDGDDDFNAYEYGNHAAREAGQGVVSGVLSTADAVWGMINRGDAEGVPDLHLQSGFDTYVETHTDLQPGSWAWRIGDYATYVAPVGGGARAGVKAGTVLGNPGRWRELGGLLGKGKPKPSPAANGGSSLDEFWKLSNVGKSRAGTTVPESFDIATAGQKFSVHPNATKHMAEYARSTGVAPPISSLAGSVETAVSRGLTPGRNFVQVGPWELGIDTRGNVIYHALYRP